MAAFSSLTDRLSNAFKHLKSKGKLSEADIDGTIREIRRALLDADVALDVVRSFTARIRERALGTEVSEALNPAQQVVKIVNEELTDVLGQGVDRPLNFAKNPPTIIMLAGLQGAGKTTLAGKLGYWLKDSGHMWEKLGHSHDEQLAYYPWPKYEEAKCVESTVEIAVQVNGKVKARLKVAADIDAAAAIAAAKADPAVAAALEGKQLVKEIYVKGRLVNLAVKG